VPAKERLDRRNGPGEHREEFLGPRDHFQIEVAVSGADRRWSRLDVRAPRPDVESESGLGVHEHEPDSRAGFKVAKRLGYATHEAGDIRVVRAREIPKHRESQHVLDRCSP
jgi:hypothetical protein